MLSLIDGSSTVEELLDISGMNRLDALRILYTLFDQRVIALVSLSADRGAGRPGFALAAVLAGPRRPR